MRFTLGTLVGVALGLAAAPIAARMPGLGPAVTDAQAQAWKILRSRTPDPPERAAHGNRSSPPPRRGGIVSIATIAAMQAEAVDPPLARTPVQSADDDADAAIAFAGNVNVGDADSVDDTAHDAAANTASDAGPRIDSGTGANRDSVGARIHPADRELDQRVGVLDRLFATYDRVDEE
ncbi:MAG: hypothetical protein V3R77_10295 [Candidatus Binatia bacterium]